MNLIDIIEDGCTNISVTVALTDLMKMVEYVLSLKSEPEKIQTGEDDDEYMTRKDVMTYLGVKGTTIHNWTVQGLLAPHKVNRKSYFKKSDVIALQRGVG